LVRRVADEAEGDAVPVTVLRDGKELDLEVTLGRRELAEGSARGQDGQQSAGPAAVLGMRLAPLTGDVLDELGLPSDMEGLVVQEVDPASPIADQGIMPGDVITAVNQNVVTSVDAFRDEVARARKAGRKS